MTIEEKKTAIAAAIKEHQDNLAAVKEAAIHPGFDPLVTAALGRALTEKLASIFAKS